MGMATLNDIVTEHMVDRRLIEVNSADDYSEHYGKRIVSVSLDVVEDTDEPGYLPVYLLVFEDNTSATIHQHDEIGLN